MLFSCPILPMLINSDHVAKLMTLRLLSCEVTTVLFPFYLRISYVYSPFLIEFYILVSLSINL